MTDTLKQATQQSAAPDRLQLRSSFLLTSLPAADELVVIALRQAWQYAKRQTVVKYHAMVNSNLLAQILISCEKLERNQISPTDFNDSVRNNAEALEGISFTNLVKLRDLAGSIELAHYRFDEDDEQETVTDLLIQMRQFVASFQ